MTERLLAHLRRCANRRGVVLAGEAELVRQLHSTSAEVTEALRTLEAAGAITVLAPFPFLVVKLRSWPGANSPERPKPPISSSKSLRMHEEVPVSSAAAAATQQREVGGAGEGTRLLEEVLTTLGSDANRDEFRQILAGHSPELIRRCLIRVRSTKRIRVSRAALFRSLLQKLSN